MANTLLAGQSASMRCVICARPARRGSVLCAQCKAGARRPRNKPRMHSKDLPHPAAPVAAMKYRERTDPLAASPRRASRAGMPQALEGWGTYATLIAFGMAVCLTGYLAIGDRESELYFGHKSPAAGGAQGSPAAQAPPVPSLAVESEVLAEGVFPAREQVAWIQWSAPAPRGLPERKPARDARARASALAPTDRRTASGESTPRFVAAEPVAVMVPPTATPELVVRDRWQELASAISRCERENLLAGIVCKERARLEYCEGEWGTAPQCVAAVASNNTR